MSQDKKSPDRKSLVKEHNNLCCFKITTIV
jgi:hypothetical protein